LASCPCYLGLITGILLGELKGINNYIFAVAGGMFLYIALVDMLPELNSTIEEISKKSIKSSVNVFILQNIGILTGIFSLFVFAKYQHNIEIYL
jgi:zinc transporter ZupT